MDALLSALDDPELPLLLWTEAFANVEVPSRVLGPSTVLCWGQEALCQRKLHESSAVVPAPPVQQVMEPELHSGSGPVVGASSAHTRMRCLQHLLSSSCRSAVRPRA